MMEVEEFSLQNLADVKKIPKHTEIISSKGHVCNETVAKTND